MNSQANDSNKEQFILSVLVANHFGVLTRISGLFSRRGYNIDSLNVGETENPGLSRMTIIVTGDDYIKSQVVKQLAKLQEVRKVELLPKSETVLREHLLIKIRTTRQTRSEIIEAVNVFRGKVVDFNTDSLVVEINGEQTKLNAFIEFTKEYGIIEICRSGALAMKRGAQAL